MPLTVYGVPVSQPCKAVMWACLYKRLPFKLDVVVPGLKQKRGALHPDYLAINPTGTIPAIEEDGFVVWESHAILTYLAQKHAWTDLYPADLQQRSIVDQYLHWHHRNAREASALVMPRFRPDIKIPPGMQAAALATVTKALTLIEGIWLADKDYIAGPSLTLADFSCYSEFGQLSAKFGNLVDFAPYPRTQEWMQRMEELPFFEEVMAPNAIMGDLSGGLPAEKLGEANKVAIKALKTAVSKL